MDFKSRYRSGRASNSGAQTFAELRRPNIYRLKANRTIACDKSILYDTSFVTTNYWSALVCLRGTASPFSPSKAASLRLSAFPPDEHATV